MMEPATWEHWKFGLIVTGKGEEKGLEKLFKLLAETGLCSFKVIRRIGQLSPITSQKRKKTMAGTGHVIPDKDGENIGLPARNYIQSANGRFVIVIDDLEWDRHKQVETVFKRYRDALDAALNENGQREKAAVHFLVMMLEAYFFADSKAINAILDLDINDYPDDVETIRSPKIDLGNLCHSYREVEHGTAIIERIRVDHILARHDCCAYLRTLFAWCVNRLNDHAFADHVQLPDYPGALAPVTSNQ